MSFVHKVDELISEHGNGLTRKAEHWESVRLADVAKVVNGFPFPSGGFNNEVGQPVLRIRDITAGKLTTYFRGAVDGAPRVERGDLVVGMDGDFNSRLWPGEAALMNQRVCKIVTDERFYAKRLLVYVLPGYLKLVNDHTSAVTVKHLSSGTIADLPLPLPPRAEQDRLVDKLDELFSRIDEGERALERAQKLVERYRQSVLKAAVTGELTREWREKHKDKLESGEAQLARILKARREAWEKAELAKMKAKGITPANDKWKQKYEEPAAPDPSELPKLPDSWAWASLPQLGEFGRGKSKHRPRNDAKLYGGSYPFLQTGRVRASGGRITEFDTTYNEVGLAQSKLWPRGTICITIAANIAESGILEFAACFPDSVVGLVPCESIVPEYIEFFVRTERTALDRYAPATAQKNINLEILEQVAVPLPPLEEQRAIYSKVQEDLSKIADVERTLAHAMAQSAALRQTTLRSAFRGRLVAQHVDDESAPILLQRIAADRGTNNAAPQRPRKKKTPA